MTFRERILVLFLLPLCWAGLCLNAQPAQLDFRQYTTDDGLPSSETYIIVEDRSGYIWIGTDNGVARFDGYEFEVFDADDGLEDMVVFGIAEDDDGNNGIAYSAGDSNKPDSLGMGITRRRLDLMNLGKDGASGMENDPLFSDTGILSGTRVTIFIRPLTSLIPAAEADKT
jgi:hypothetical protein